MKIISIILLLILISCTETSKTQENIYDDNDKILLLGTFNIEWLGEGNNDRKPRVEEDYKNIAEVIKKTGVEFFGLQEIENENSLLRVLKYLPDWTYIFNKSHSSSLNTCFIFKKYLNVEDLGNYEGINVEKQTTRPGSVVRLKHGKLDIHILNVHLKSTSGYDNTDEKKEHSYMLRRLQSIEIVNFKDSIINNNINNKVIVLGDFNDNPIREEESNILLLDSNFKFPTKYLASCKNEFWDVIDHIILSDDLFNHYQPSSAYVFDIFSVFLNQKADMISDHCPVMIRLND